MQGTLAIEGNTLALDKVTALLEGKRVAGPAHEVREVLNALKVYEEMARFEAHSAKSLLKAHAMMMDGLITDAGQWRSGNVGILKGAAVSHIAPQPDRVPHLMEDLFQFLGNEEWHPLIRSAVFHYELEFIHPFGDGNGRIGRFWQSLLLSRYHSAFEFVPVESLIRDHQTDYYLALEASDRSGDSTTFVEFSLGMIQGALEDFLTSFKPKSLSSVERLETARVHFGREDFSRKDYLSLFKTIATATASRDLKQGVDEGLLSKEGEKALTRYCFLEPPIVR